MIRAENKEKMCRKLRFFFRCSFLAVMLMTSVPYIKWELEPYLKLFLVFGAVCIAADLYCGGRSLKDPSIWALGVFCGAYVVSIFVNRSSNFSANFRNLLYMGVVFLVCYGDSRSCCRDDGRRTADGCGQDLGKGRTAAYGRNPDDRNTADGCGQDLGKGRTAAYGRSLDDRRIECGWDEGGSINNVRREEEDRGAEKHESFLGEFRTYLRIMSVGTFLLSSVCLATYILKINVMYVRQDRRGYLGFWDDRLWGLYNANTNGFLCAVSIFISVFFIMWNIGRARRVIRKGIRRGELLFDIINIVLQTICLSLSYSRTSIMALAFGVMLIICLPGGFLKKPDTVIRGNTFGAGDAIGAGNTTRAGLASWPRRLFIAVIAGLLVVLFCLGLHRFLSAVYVKPNRNPLVVTVSAGRSQVFAAESDINNGDDSIQAGSGNKDSDNVDAANAGTVANAGAASVNSDADDGGVSKPEEDVQLSADTEEQEEKKYDAWGRELREGEDGMLTGRPMLWLAGCRTFLESPVFGITRENLSQRVGANLSDQGWISDLEAGGVHNGPLTVLICSGLAGFVPMLVFAAILIHRIGRGLHPLLSGHIWERTEEPDKQEMYFALAGTVTLVMLFVVTEMTESRILYQANAFFAFFWTICGYASVMSRSFRKES